MTSHATEQDWRAVLDREIQATSQTDAAKRLGYQHPGGIWRFLHGQAKPKACRIIETRVRHVLIEGKPLATLPEAARAPRKLAHCQKPLPPGTTRRTCLKCGSPFPSWGAGNRLCSPCHSGNRREGEHGGIF